MCLPVAGSLPASKTHASRRWTFIASSDATQPALGVLTIVQGKRDAVSYAIAVEGGQVLFVRLDDAAEVYGVDFDRHGRPARCTCKGFSFTKHCKHVDATREMIADGVITTQPALQLA